MNNSGSFAKIPHAFSNIQDPRGQIIASSMPKQPQQYLQRGEGHIDSQNTSLGSMRQIQSQRNPTNDRYERLNPVLQSPKQLTQNQAHFQQQQLLRQLTGGSLNRINSFSGFMNNNNNSLQNTQFNTSGSGTQILLAEEHQKKAEMVAAVRYGDDSSRRNSTGVMPNGRLFDSQNIPINLNTMNSNGFPVYLQRKGSQIQQQQQQQILNLSQNGQQSNLNLSQRNMFQQTNQNNINNIQQQGNNNIIQATQSNGVNNLLNLNGIQNNNMNISSRRQITQNSDRRSNMTQYSPSPNSQIFHQDLSERKSKKLENLFSEKIQLLSSGKIQEMEQDNQIDGYITFPTQQQVQKSHLSTPRESMQKLGSSRLQQILCTGSSNKSLPSEQISAIQFIPNILEHHGEINQIVNSNDYQGFNKQANMQTSIGQNWQKPANNLDIETALKNKISELERALNTAQIQLESSQKHQQNLEKKIKMLIKQNELLLESEDIDPARKQEVIQIQQSQILSDFETKIQELVEENERINGLLMASDSVMNKRANQLALKNKVLQEGEVKLKEKIENLENEKVKFSKKVKDLAKQLQKQEENQIEQMSSTVKELEQKIDKLVKENERLNKLTNSNSPLDEITNKLKKEKEDLKYQSEYWRDKCVQLQRKKNIEDSEKKKETVINNISSPNILQNKLIQNNSKYQGVPDKTSSGERIIDLENKLKLVFSQNEQLDTILSEQINLTQTFSKNSNIKGSQQNHLTSEEPSTSPSSS